MKTKILSGKLNDLKVAGEIIRKNGIIVFPTETVYGIGANAFNANAVRKIFVAKNRPVDNPLIVHVASVKDTEKVVKEIPNSAKKLMNKFWPGPLTLVLKKNEVISSIVTAGLKTVAVRMPANKIALSFIRESKVPIAAPSANISGKPSGTNFNDVYQDFNGKVDAIIDGGKTDVGIESTILDLTGKIPIILRPGKISLKELEEILGNVKVYNKKSNIPKSPGLKYEHYSPSAKVVLVENKNKIERVCNHYKDLGKKVIFIGLSKRKLNVDSIIFKNNEEFAKKVFALFREFDRKKFGVIIVEGVDKSGIGMALMNRVRKAASVIIK